MRKNWKLRIASDLRGKITTGMKGLSKGGKEIPKSLDYFNISKFPELQDAYGDKPDRLIIVFGIEDMNLFFQTEYVVWAQSDKGAWKKRQCDGETCRHLVPEVINGVKYSRGDEHECFGCGSDDCSIPADDQCKCYTGFSAYVVDPRIGRVVQFTPYRFQTNSVNSSDNILSTLHTIFEQYGGVPKALPFELTVRMAEQQTDTGKTRFPLWYLKPWGTVHQINEFVKRTALPTNEDNSIITDSSKLLQSGTSAEKSNEDVPVGVDVNDPYPEDSTPDAEISSEEEVVIPGEDPEEVLAREKVDAAHPGEAQGLSEERAKELVAEITGTDPEDVEVVDILNQRGILSKIELNMDDSKQVIAYTVKMIMEMVKDDKTRARNKLKKYSTSEKDGFPGYTSSKEVLERGHKLVKMVFDRCAADYRTHLQKLQAKEDQKSIL